MLRKIVSQLTHFKPVSPARACLIKADGLREHGHYDDALLEAKKARDEKSATCHEIKLAKGRIVEILELKKNAPHVGKV